MYKTNLKEIVRWALKKKTTTILIISGMAIGITIALLIGLWGLNEFSFDQFHANADRIYRVCRQGYINNESLTLGSDFGTVGTISKEKFPQIENVCRVVPMSRESVKILKKSTYEDHIATADQNFFQFFSFKIENGNPVSCLDAPDKIVIDRQTANKYFQNESALGQIIEIYGQQLHVSAVMENMPENSHLKYNIILPVSSIPWLKNSGWGSNDGFITYLLLEKGTDIKTLAKNISAMTYENFPTYEKFKITHFLQPLTEIHFSQGFRFDNVITSDRRNVFIFISLAILILLIASFNFINMFISTSFLRAKSIGVKKINGSSRASLFLSSYIETGLYILTSTCIAILLTKILLPSFNMLSGTNLTFNFTDYRVFLYAGILFLSTIFISGTFPVIYILRFNPEAIIRNRFKGSGVTLLQRTLIISQFVASIILISSAGMIKKQLNYVENMDLGFNKDQIIYIYPGNMANSYDAVRNELLKNPNIVDVTAKNCLPDQWNNGSDVALADNASEAKIMEICSMKDNYADVMQMSLIEGRNPFLPGQENKNECLINEQAAISLGLKAPVGKRIKRGTDRFYTIAGVLKNANTKSLHIKVDPQVYLNLNQVEGYYPLLIKTNGQSESVINSLSKIWNQYNTDTPFEYHFLDDAYDKLYKTEKTSSKIISIGMVIALFLAFMGLYAISHYATERRVKEIGIRKVNGARISEVLLLLNRDFVRWVLISVFIATPITWFILHKWLDNFAYKTNLSWWIFALAGLLALGIAVLTVSWQSWKAATRNPIEALRYE
jgi:putative ABC transport system permease protein